LQPRDCAIGADAKIDMVTKKASCPKYVSLPATVSIGKLITLWQRVSLAFMPG